MTNEKFKSIMSDCIKITARDNATFTNDDVFDTFDRRFPGQSPEDRRIYGSVVKQALESGIMEWTGHAKVSRRKNCNKMLIRVYNSKIYDKVLDKPTPRMLQFAKDVGNYLFGR